MEVETILVHGGVHATVFVDGVEEDEKQVEMD